MVDRDDDLAVGVKSTAILFGKHDLMLIGMLMGVMILMLAALGRILHLTWPWYLGLLLAALLFCWQLYLSRSRDRDACFRAFLINNWVGLVIFTGLAGHLALLGELFRY
jgi:4-hydroxybenzoate polyprenyltransferase